MTKSSSFISYLSDLLSGAPAETVSSIAEKAGGWDRVYLVFVDILKGFCETGALASQRVNEMVDPVARLAAECLDKGLPSENLIFLNDHHPPDAVEFAAFAPHCVRGTAEAEVVEPLKDIQMRKGVQTFTKNATNGLFGQNAEGVRFFEWLENVFTSGTSAFLVVGDCTDLCIYQNAMGIRLLANEKNADTRVIVPKSHVRTYDISVEQAQQLGILAHDGDLMDLVFLYHMKLNGIEILSSISHE
ncbi:isochorismatase family protein [Lihuaxuella thermophila]|uniref:Nicotinamidase-related amidase n=1 Tax=Lihuaxuella thermophila TaxID=1173111 RepID=A0A1H8DGN9_9BACL|nr:isochorismatase family protein [Lihuaxuella thermophila]SEN05637.1 Nicotinamidase-related amidase [Lihuaxuella thermophila]